MRGLQDIIKPVHFCTLQRAQITSCDFVTRADEAIRHFLIENDLDANGLAFSVVGSVGRREALEASDLDLIPVARDDECLSRYKPMDRRLREWLEQQLNVKVSQGEDLTKAISFSVTAQPAPGWHGCSVA